MKAKPPIAQYLPVSTYAHGTTSSPPAEKSDVTVREQLVDPAALERAVGDGRRSTVSEQRGPWRARPSLDVKPRRPEPRSPVRPMDRARLAGAMRRPITPGYVGIEPRKNGWHVSISRGGAVTSEFVKRGGRGDWSALVDWLARHQEAHAIKVVAAGIEAEALTPEVRSRLWLDADVVPIAINATKRSGREAARELASKVAGEFDANQNVLVHIGRDHEVQVSDLGSIEDYQRLVPPAMFARMRAEAERFRGKKMVFLSSTPQGGGVALMRHAQMRLYRLLGVDAQWHVLEPEPGIFDITKRKIHNAMQNVGGPNAVLTDEDVERLRSWSEKNAEILAPAYMEADVVVIDDPQPAGLIPHIRAQRPDVPILYRSHTHLETDLIREEGTRANAAWSKWVWPNAERADAFISHPVESFVPDDVPPEKTVFMQPTTDELDGLNKPLAEWEAAYYLQGLNRALEATGQTPLDLARPYITQVARFDPSKGIPDVLETYRVLRERLEAEGREVPQLVIAGHGASDDPEGQPIFNEVMAALGSARYEHLAGDVKVARLPHNDQLLNVVMTLAWAGMQLSHEEGWEIKVTEGRRKGVPMVVSDAGGIPLQLGDGGGWIVPVGATERAADHLYDLWTDPALYEATSKKAADVGLEGFTPMNALNWLVLANRFVEGEGLGGARRSIGDVVAA